MRNAINRNAMSRFVKMRAMEAGGVILGVFSLGLLAAIADFEPFMDSLNAAGGASNIVFGIVGGAAADFALQVYGSWGSAALLAVMFIYSVKLCRKNPPSYWILRLVALLTATAVGGGVAELVTPNAAHNGFLGGMFAYGVKAVVPAALLLPVAVPLSVLVFLLLFYEAAALSLAQWLDFFSLLKRALGLVVLPLRLLGTWAFAAAWRLLRGDAGRRLRRMDAARFRFKGPKVIPTLADKIGEGNRARWQRAPAMFAEKSNNKYEVPFYLLEDLKAVPEAVNEAALRANAQMLSQVLLDYGIEGSIEKVSPGPVITLYELAPKAGVKSSRVVSLGDDIARSMSAISARIAPVAGRNVIGIELPNDARQSVFLREILSSREYERSHAELPLALGKDIGGRPVIVDLARMPHMLIAGTTGSGKSVGLNAMILSLLYRLSPAECRLIMVDPKMLELSVYDGITHLMMPVVTEPKKAIAAFKWVVKEMERRYRLIAEAGCRNRASYNARLTGGESAEAPLPLIVIIVDEMADLMLIAGKEIDGTVQRLSQMARAAGIHLIMATQRPSVDVITGTIKANFPCRLSFQVSSKIDSRTVLGEGGAENLLGAGDMLYLAAGGRLTRVHGPFVSEKEVARVAGWLKANLGEPQYVEDLITAASNLETAERDEEDELFAQAVELVRSKQKASTSLIQRYFKIGYNRAANLIEEMEAKGVVGEANHVGKREVFIK